jgi:hypothetical protein
VRIWIALRFVSIRSFGTEQAHLAFFSLVLQSNARTVP